ncbi:50S ribosomal protein L1 [Patescibacteria group bacterium]|nr:50S ribosomal protein L1 [Patescibacteria group bacterium]
MAVKRGKKYQEAKKLVEKDFYAMDEAVALLVKTGITKFDSSCEVHMHLGVNPKHADQMVRATVVLPHGTGKKLRVVAFCSDENVKEAKEAGAIEAGSTELIKKIAEGWLEFDIAVASPDVMKDIGKIAKILGQQGLMPNPKAGTVTPNLKTTIKEILKGKIEFRNDKLSNLHNIFGKISFGADKLKENLETYVKAVAEAKPEGAKGTYIKSITLSTTMGPGIKVHTGEKAA